MSLSMYQASLPVLNDLLGNLDAILDKAISDADARAFEQTVLVNARLAPDMFPLAKQVQIMSDMAKSCAARLSGETPPVFEDTETTFPELKLRIQKTRDYINGFKSEQIDGTENNTITIKAGGKEWNFTGQDYLLRFIIPNFYFHMSMTYAILRHNGLGIGKMDYLMGNKAA